MYVNLKDGVPKSQIIDVEFDFSLIETL